MDSPAFFNGNVIDIEASGLASNSYPIEVGIVLGDGQKFQCLIKPLPHWQHWDEHAQALHGITREQLQRDGVDIKTVCKKINEFCKGRTLYSDCWVADYRWLNLLFAEASVKMEFFCNPTEYFLPDEERPQWMNYRHQYLAENGIQAHRALNDAVVIANTLERHLFNQHQQHSFYSRQKLQRVDAITSLNSPQQSVA